MATWTRDPLGALGVPACCINLLYVQRDEQCYSLIYSPTGVPLVDSIIRGMTTDAVGGGESSGGKGVCATA